MRGFFQRLLGRLRSPELEPGLAALVGLGNPVPEYAGTRHNLGADTLTAFLDDAFIKHRFSLRHSKVFLFQRKKSRGLVFIPLTYMNHSGRAVAEIIQFLSVRSPESRMLVMYDDLDLPLGRMRFRKSGGPGGHNGIKSIISETGTKDFYRLRLGIGNDLSSRDPDFVLSPFEEKEIALLHELTLKVHEALDCYASEGMDAAMTSFNGLSLTP